MLRGFWASSSPTLHNSHQYSAQDGANWALLGCTVYHHASPRGLCLLTAPQISPMVYMGLDAHCAVGDGQTAVLHAAFPLLPHFADPEAEEEE